MTHPVYVRKEKHRGRPDGRPVSFGYHHSGSVGITDALEPEFGTFFFFCFVLDGKIPGPLTPVTTDAA